MVCEEKNLVEDSQACFFLPFCSLSFWHFTVDQPKVDGIHAQAILLLASNSGKRNWWGKRLKSMI